MGGGFTATSMLCQLVNKIQTRSDSGLLDPQIFDLAIFEKTKDFGPGFPHNDRLMMPYHITNMCAADMGVFADDPGDFQAWVNQNLTHLKERFSTYPEEAFLPSSSSTPCRHYPRAFMGQYLRKRFQEATLKARQMGIKLTLYPLHEVIDVRSDDKLNFLAAVKIGTDEQICITADALLMATGHWFSKNRQTNYFDSPWPAKKLLERIPSGASVAVMGTSLSAIETVLTLTSDGHFEDLADGRLRYIPGPEPRKITLYSRHGLLPKVRGQIGSYRNRFLNTSALNIDCHPIDNLPTLKASFRLLDSELENAYGCAMDWTEVTHPGARPEDNLIQYLKDAEQGDGPGGDIIWQTVLSQTFAFIKDWYANLTANDRQIFDQNFTSIFFTHAATQPRVNASKMLALMAAKQVKVVKLGMDYRFDQDRLQHRFHFNYRDEDGNAKSDTYRYVVNAKGQQKSFKSNPSKLAQNLMASGNMPPDRTLLPQENMKGDLEGIDPSPIIHQTESLTIDPSTHRVLSFSPGRKVSGNVYAVGAMTRPQIINASMAHGISSSTATIAEELLDMVAERYE